MSSTLTVPTEDPVISATGQPDASASRPTIPRRHDLDALRAIAMLLGIALHGALSFIPLPGEGWAVQDVRQSDAFAVFMGLIHGFRMPIFFLISGFFTAMLWRRRGLKALLWHRFKRIFLPLAIGMFTIVPAVWVVVIGAGILQSREVAGEIEADLWSAAKTGNLEKIQAQLGRGVAINELDAVFGATPLTMAAWNGNPEAMEALISAGADVNARNRDGSTPLHGAALFGHQEAFDLLVDGGAETSARNRVGKTPLDSLGGPWGRTMILGNVLGITIDPATVFQGRKAIAETVQSDGTGQTPVKIDAMNRAEQLAGLSALMVLLTLFPLFHHLWFLWFLCWLVLAFALYAWIAGRLKWKVPDRLVATPLRYAWLIPVAFVPQAMMGILGPNFGPDTSTGLIPIPQILVYYAIFFFFGAIYFDSDDQEAKLGSRWYATLPLALLVVFPLGYEMTTGHWGFSNEWLNSRLYRPAAVALQVTYTWLMCFGLMGAFRRVYSDESKTMRYVSDSSYWLYLAHLPLIMVVQVLVRNWQAPAIVKFTFVCTVTTAILLASYQLFVRYTPIGTLLNGPRPRPSKPASSLPATGEAPA